VKDFGIPSVEEVLKVDEHESAVTGFSTFSSLALSHHLLSHLFQSYAATGSIPGTMTLVPRVSPIDLPMDI
jgi:hypothetical protein